MALSGPSPVRGVLDNMRDLQEHMEGRRLITRAKPEMTQAVEYVTQQAMDRQMVLQERTG
jgi:hypothetical protein